MKRVEQTPENSNLIDKITSMCVWLPCRPHKMPSRAACGRKPQFGHSWLIKLRLPV